MAAAASAPDAALGKPPADIVLPPSNVRGIIEATSAYVARNGKAFEEKIRQRYLSGTTTLGFINEDDPYHAFYLWRVEEIKSGRGNAPDGRSAGAAAPVPEAPKGPAAPPEFHFSARMPNISAQDLDVVRLTALFVAKNGRSFVTTLSQKESGNFQFDFLRPQHSLYQFFSRLVDQYSELLNANGADATRAEKERLAELGKNTTDRFHLLGRAKQRAEWVKFQEQQKAKQEEKEEREKLEYQQIDWHDFAVVEMIVFTEDDDEKELPPPISLNDLQSASLEQKGAMSINAANMRIEEAVPFDDVSFNVSNEGQQQPRYPHQPSPANLPSRPPPPMSTDSPTPHPQALPEETLSRERAANREAAQASAARPGAGGPMKIRNDYVPRAQQRRATAGQVICPNCNLPFPADQINEHMRIELLDPRWQQQRAKAEGRSATTNLNTADVANNLKRLASQRSDVFDSATGQPLTPEESDRRKKQTAGFAQMPAQAGMPGMTQGMSIPEQLEHFKNKAKQGGQ